MVFIKVKWIPWLMIIGSIIIICSGEGNAWTGILLIVGIILAVIQVNNKKKNTITQNKTPLQSSAPYPGNTPIQKSTPDQGYISNQNSSSNQNGIYSQSTGSGNANTLNYNSQTSNYTQNVNTASITTKKCPSCGNIESKEMVFCSKCGTLLK